MSSCLPALSIILINLGWWVMSMKALSSNIMEEDYITFARYKGLRDRRIIAGYILPNAALPQITVLALQLGGVFNGALITEILFGYPGVGTLIYQSVLQSDYNLMLGSYKPGDCCCSNSDARSRPLLPDSRSSNS